VGYSVGQVAERTGVTVRTLHHYDEIGLLSPSGRTAAGYRQYADADVERLAQIVRYRELSFGLDEIAKLLDDPDTEPLDHLRRQHALITERLAHLQRVVMSIEKAMEAAQVGIKLSPEEMFEVVGDQDPTQHAEEAEQRWGDTDAYRESHRRTSQYTKEDWLQIKTEGAEIDRRFAAALRSGLPSTSDEATAAAEAHRQQISRWFYECGYDMHRGLAEMYVADPRFTERYEQVAPGLAVYVRDAINANADRAEAAGQP
jgi:DNA-binding transcriptional MerR regulator